MKYLFTWVTQDKFKLNQIRYDWIYDRFGSFIFTLSNQKIPKKT
jgi:hypothetical protein